MAVTHKFQVKARKAGWRYHYAVSCECGWKHTGVSPASSSAAKTVWNRHMTVLKQKEEGIRHPLLYVGHYQEHKTIKFQSRVFVGNIYGRVPAKGARQAKTKRDQQAEWIFYKPYPWAMWVEHRNVYGRHWELRCFRTRDQAQMAAMNRIQLFIDRGHLGEINPTVRRAELPELKRIVAPSINEYMALLAGQAKSGRIKDRTTALKNLKKMRATAQMVIDHCDQVELELFSLD